MGRILLHIGTHKTGTTSIQRFADRNRNGLAQIGLHYPSYKAIGTAGHYAHLDVAKAIMGSKTRLGADGLKAFATHVLERARDFEATLISAEPFWRGVMGARQPTDPDAYWPARRAFIARVAEIFPTDRVEIVAVFRGQADFAESLFQEDVKVNRWRQNLRAFATQRNSVLRYGEQMDAWAEFYPSISALNFETLRSDGALVTRFFAEMGFDVAHLPASKRFNDSIQADFVTALRMLNRSELDSDQIADARERLIALQNVPAVAGWAPRCLWHSARVRNEFDAGFHTENDRMTGRFSKSSDPIRSRQLPDNATFGERMTESAIATLLGHLMGTPAEVPPVAESILTVNGGFPANEMLSR